MAFTFLIEGCSSFMIADGNRCIDVPGTETIKGVKYFNYNESFDRWEWDSLNDEHFTNEELLESNVLLNNQVKLVSFEFRLFGLYITETSRYSGFLNRPENGICRSLVDEVDLKSL